MDVHNVLSCACSGLRSCREVRHVKVQEQVLAPGLGSCQAGTVECRSFAGEPPLWRGDAQNLALELTIEFAGQAMDDMALRH